MIYLLFNTSRLDYDDIFRLFQEVASMDKYISFVVNKGGRPLPGYKSEMSWPSGFT